MRSIFADLRIAARRLRCSPGFTLTIVLTLTTAIAANLVVFGVINAAILRPLNVAHADRLFEIEQRQPGFITQSYPDVEDYRARNSAFAAIAAYRFGETGVATGGTATQAWNYEVTGNYFDMLGVQPELGRFFHASDERGINSAPYVVLSDGYWRSRFAANPRIVGSTVDLNKHQFTVIGVAPPSFHGTELFFWPDFWVPFVNSPELDGYNSLQNRYTHNLFVLGLVKPGVTRQQAAQNLNSIAAQLAKQYPQTDDQLGARLTTPGLMGDVLGGPARDFLAGVFLLALLVLAAACVNLASIFAARAADRGRELAIRMAIGSGRWRLMRQVLAEAGLLSLAGGAVGTAASAALMHALSQWRPIAEYPIHVTVDVDARVYLIAVLLAVLSGLLPALLTARQIWRTDAMQAMRGTAQTSFRRLSLRDLLLGLQVALCALLVSSALVGLRGMERSLHARFGFNPQGAELVETSMLMAGYSDASALPVQKRMIEAARRIPGVTAAGTIDEPPMNGGGNSEPVFRQGTADFRSSNSVAAPLFYIVSPGYLQASGLRLLAGRNFTWDDNAKSPRVALINEALAHILFGNAPAVGRRFMDSGPKTYLIAGVVENGKYVSLTENPRPAMFWPLAQDNEEHTTLVVRSRRTPAETAAALSAMMASIDPGLPVTIQSWPQQLQLVLFPARVATVALGLLGLLAAMLAATGIFGMASYAVARRLREMGIRVALGARRVQVLQAALGRTLLLLTFGSLAGLVLGALASRVLSSIVYEATVFDPIVMAGAVAAMVAIGMLAAAVPARRAIQADPAVLLREE
ncbi:MAG: ADOP family duplicated permease [Terracidiphilus sp.]